MRETGNRNVIRRVILAAAVVSTSASAFAAVTVTAVPLIPLGSGLERRKTNFSYLMAVNNTLNTDQPAYGPYGVAGLQEDATEPFLNESGTGIRWTVLSTTVAGHRVDAGSAAGVSNQCLGGNDVNDSGVIVATSLNYGQIGANQGYVPLVINGTTVSVLPTVNNTVQASAQGINNAGVIVGNDRSNPNAHQQAVIWTKSGSTYNVAQLPTGSYAQSQARRISDSGIVVGQIEGQAALWKPTGTGEYNVGQMLPKPASATVWAGDLNNPFRDLGGGCAINASGVIVGGKSDVGAMRWVPDGSGNYTTYQNLGRLSPTDDNTYALGINSVGTIVGVSGMRNGLSVGSAPFLGMMGYGEGSFWQSSVIGNFNDSGVVQIPSKANYTDPTAQLNTFTAFIWTESGGMASLDSLLAGTPYAGWHIALAGDINDAGVIAGMGRPNSASPYQAVFVTVPEPTSAVLAGVSLLGLLLGRRERKGTVKN